MSDIIIKKFNEKKQKVNTLINNDNLSEIEKNSLIEKIELLEEMLNDSACFTRINIEVAFSILEFLEIPENEMLEVYCKLIDPENMQNDDTFLLIDRSK